MELCGCGLHNKKKEEKDSQIRSTIAGESERAKGRKEYCIINTSQATIPVQYKQKTIRKKQKTKKFSILSLPRSWLKGFYFSLLQCNTKLNAVAQKTGKSKEKKKEGRLIDTVD